jgi:hypothetical protein
MKNLENGFDSPLNAFSASFISRSGMFNDFKVGFDAQMRVKNIKRNEVQSNA